MYSMPELQIQQMSFRFPQQFYDLMFALKKKYNKDMTYIIMDAVNEWAIQKEGLKAYDEMLWGEEGERLQSTA